MKSAPTASCTGRGGVVHCEHMILKGMLILFVGVVIGAGGAVLVGMHNQSQSAEDVPPGASDGLISISRDDARTSHKEYCATLKNSTARYKEERACNDLCGVIDVERKLCFYADVQVDEFGSRVVDRERASCEASGGVLPRCTASRCDSDGSCTEDCAVACHFKSLTPIR